MPLVSTSLLADPLLEGCRGRAAGYDRDNRFCQEDFDELKAAGYLKMALPKEFGGYGLTLAEAGRETRRLATYAPATALCLNMHHYWVGLAADVWRSGDKSVEWILRDAGAGEVFAAGHAESGNETSVLMSITKAERVDGGYKFTGRKSFGSLSPVWTRFGLHGMDTSDPSAPKVVHAFMPRDTKGYTIKETWDVMGMRDAQRRYAARGRLHPRQIHCARGAGRVCRRRLLHPRYFRVGARRFRQRLLRSGPARD